MGKLLTAIIVLMLCLSVFAQNEKKWLYFGTRVGGGIGMSTPDKNNDVYREIGDGEYLVSLKRNIGSFDIAPFFISVQFTDIFALQTELFFTRYSYGSIEKEGADWDYCILSRKAVVIPILTQITLFDRKLRLFAGLHITGNLEKVDEYNGANFDEIWKEDGKIHSKKYNGMDRHGGFSIDVEYPIGGLVVGTAFGFKAGPGNIIFDIRYLADIGNVKLVSYSGSIFIGGGAYRENLVHRAKLSFTAGYEFGVINRK